MEYWTFLVITLAAPYDDYASTLPYRTLDECWKAAPIVVETMPMAVDAVQCVETGVIATTIRPRPRPAALCAIEEGEPCP